MPGHVRDPCCSASHLRNHAERRAMTAAGRKLAGGSVAMWQGDLLLESTVGCCGCGHKTSRPAQSRPEQLSLEQAKWHKN